MQSILHRLTSKLREPRRLVANVSRICKQHRRYGGVNICYFLFLGSEIPKKVAVDCRGGADEIKQKDSKKKKGSATYVHVVGIDVIRVLGILPCQGS